MKALEGSQAIISYIIADETGIEIERSAVDNPVSFKIGDGEIIAGIEEAVIGMEVGDKKEFTLKPEKGFGEYQENLISRLSKEDFGDILPKEGDIIDLETDEGRLVKAVVCAIEEGYVTIDMNHPLAGQNLRFYIELHSFT